MSFFATFVWFICYREMLSWIWIALVFIIFFNFVGAHLLINICFNRLTKNIPLQIFASSIPVGTNQKIFAFSHFFYLSVMLHCYNWTKNIKHNSRTIFMETMRMDHTEDGHMHVIGIIQKMSKNIWTFAKTCMGTKLMCST